ncbi:MAG: dephospho-CoA kinase [Ornithinimicrobium sp.]
MLKVGLSGGIGSGKSTVARRLASRGAVVVDSDAIARDVVAPGTVGLAEVAATFGDRVLTADGSLDRPALGAVVFGDVDARRALEALTHPRIAQRTAELFASAPADAVVVHDVPLLVEKAMGSAYHLVAIVGAGEEERMRRLVEHRGMDPRQARSRIESQADEAARRAAADVWLDNRENLPALIEATDALWDERLVPFEHNVRHRIPARGSPRLPIRESDPTWPAQAERIIARLRRALGEVAVAIEHVGSTAVAGMPAKDEIDLQVAVRALADLDGEQIQHDAAAAGFIALPGPAWDRAHERGPDEVTPKRFLAGADPQRVVHIHVRDVEGVARRRALMFRDWLRADPSAREDYAGLKRSLLEADLTSTEYAQAKEPWCAEAFGRARAWASSTGWSIS